MQPLTSRFAGVLFDLDGTLLDTALDLGATTNRILARYHTGGSISDETARAVASDGMRALMKAGVPVEKHHKFDFEKMRVDFLPDYYAHIADRTCFFPGMDQVLRALTNAQIPFAVVTNKPDHLAQELLSKFPEFKAMKSLVGCDLLPVAKPDPAPLYYACGEMHVKPQQCIYVGDHKRDMEAGHNASMPTALALWGYLGPNPDLKAYNADFEVKSPQDLLKLLLA